MPSYIAHIETIETALVSLLKTIPGMVVDQNEILTSAKSAILFYGIDDIDQPDQKHGLEIPVKTPSGQNWTMAVLTKANGEPRLVRESCAWLRSAIDRSSQSNLYPVIAATYISNRAAQICNEMNVGYIDLSGNCRLAFDSIFIEKAGVQNKQIEKRPLRSLFSPKSSRIIRLLLENPFKTWGVQDLATAANISLGLASKVKHKLLALDLIFDNNEGIKLKDPEVVLLDWAKNYSYKDNELLPCYAPGGMYELEDKLSKYCQQHKIRHALTLFSAANRVAPFVRGLSQSAIYIEADLKQTASDLGWKPVPSGANFLLLKPFDDFILYNSRIVQESSYPIVSNIQLYLDLASHKGRGEEAAEFLLEQKIKPQLENWENKPAI